MMKLFSWVVVGLALLGALLVTSMDSHVRSVAFGLWVFTNLWWAIHNYRKKDYPLAAQFLFFLILAIFGVYNNRL